MDTENLPSNGHVDDAHPSNGHVDDAHMLLASALRRNEEAQARDAAARRRDQLAERRERAAALLQAGERERGALTDEQLERAAHQRTLAAEDRRANTDYREEAARDRRQAIADREALIRQLAIAETDPLTGARTRGPGLTDLDREIDRCRRTGSSLVVAYIDVVGLKVVNDDRGHAAGDTLLRSVVQLIRQHLRSYDLVIRLGGDEFLCAMSNMTLDDARARVGEVASALGREPVPGAIRAGYSELTPDETARRLIARADRQLIGEKGDRARR